MKMYKLFRGLLKASALTTVMFIMQACYGTPNGYEKLEYPQDSELTDEVTTTPAEETATLNDDANMDVITEPVE